MRSLSESLQQAEAKNNVRVINIAPGFVKTNIHQGMGISFEEYTRATGNPDFIAPERMPYDRVYDTAEIPVLLEDLGTHLRANGYRGDLVLKESNDTPLRPLAATFPQDVQDALPALYADDFEHLGYDSEMPAKLHPGDAYPSQALAEVRRLIERHERIGDLADSALLLKEQLAEARKGGSRARRASLARRLRQRVTAVLPGR